MAADHTTETQTVTEHEGGIHTPGLAPHAFGHVGPFAITDAAVGAVVVAGILSIVALYASRTFKLIPTKLQIVFEMLAEYIMGELEAAFGSRAEARRVFPLIFTLLLFILLANQLGLFPVIMQITWHGEFLVRQPTTSLSGTAALAILVIGVSHVLALQVAPIHHLERFFPIHKFMKARSFGDLFQAGIDSFVGLLELIGEFAKTLSLAARLFGNVFAGLVMGEVVRALVPYGAPIPFAAIEIFAGCVQAAVFVLLSIQFIAATVAHARPHIEHVDSGKAHAH